MVWITEIVRSRTYAVKYKIRYLPTSVRPAKVVPFGHKFRLTQGVDFSSGARKVQVWAVSLPSSSVIMC